MFTIFIADDQKLFLQGLKVIIDSEDDMKVVGTAENGLEALEKIRKVNPNIVLMDIRMPIMSGIECTKRLRVEFPDLIIIILTTFHEEEYLIEGLMLGANGYLLKGIEFNELLTSIRKAAIGQLTIPVEIAQKLALRLRDSYKTMKDSDTIIDDLQTQLHVEFTPREKEILNLLLTGKTNRQIAEALFISPGTVKNYLSFIYQKLNVNKRIEVIQLVEEIAAKAP